MDTFLEEINLGGLSYTYEGPEKKLEIILFTSQPGLRDNNDRRWERVVKASRSDIISQTSTKYLDAYLLSESSLFVWDDRILMITCGKTTLIETLPEIIKIVDREKVALVFYERKNFMFPQEQPADFEEDVVLIEKHFPGKSYRLGPANHDHIHVFYSSHAKTQIEQDATLQVLMHGIDPSVIDIFCPQDTKNRDQIGKHSGLNRIYPHMETDSHLFSPDGYSINGIFADKYYTVHVTPHSDWSYASFETNVLETDYSEIIKQVVSIFKPEKFSLLLTTSMDEKYLDGYSTLANVISEYNVTEKSLYEFDCGYSIMFLNCSYA